MSDLGGSIDIESDCEGDPLELGGGAQRKNEHKREPVGAVFLVGSFSAYAPFHLIALPRRLTRFPAGNHVSSIAAQTISCLPLSNPKGSTLAQSTSTKKR